MPQSNPRGVLVIDEDGDARKRLTSELRARSLVTDEAENEKDAIDLLSRHAYGVVLLALMPEGAGLDVLDLVAPSEVSPLVLVLADRPPQRRARLGAMRVHGIVRKPFDPVEVAELVAECARNVRSGEAAGGAAMTLPPLPASESVLDQS